MKERTAAAVLFDLKMSRVQSELFRVQSEVFRAPSALPTLFEISTN